MNFARFFLLLALIFFPTASFAAPTLELKEDGLYVSNISFAETEQLFADYNYTKYIIRAENKYPPIFLSEMPYDFRDHPDRNERINLFIRIMIPLALKLNEELLLERLEFVEIRLQFRENQALPEEQIARLEALAEKYDVFSRLKGLRRYNVLLERLDEKINIMSPSIMVANAAIETSWGEADALYQANSLYKELVWYTDEGLKVEDDSDDSYRIKIFPDLYSAMQSRALKINSDVNYEIFRYSRADRLNRGKLLNGRDMAHNVLSNSNLPNFVGLLNYTITFYELQNIDGTTLGFPTKNK